MRGRLGILSNLGILGAMQAVVLLVNWVAVVYLARTLGEHWFGVVQYGVTLSAFALILAEAGLWALGIREVARLDDPEQVRRYASRHLGLMAILAGLVLAAGAAVLPGLRIVREDPWIFGLYVGLVIPQVAMLDWVGLGLERMAATSVVKICRSLFYALLVLLLLRYLDGVGGWPAARWVPAMLIAGHLASNALMARQVGRWLGRSVRPAWGGWADSRGRLAQAVPIGVGNVAVRVVMAMDLLVLGLYREPQVVGIYSAAVKILVYMVVGIEVLWDALLPRLSRLWEEAPVRFRGNLNLALGLVWAAFVPVAVGGMVVGPQLLAALYGGRYAEAGPIFRVLCFSYLALSLGLFLGNVLIASNRQRDLAAPRLGSAALAVAASFALVPRFGAMGACLAMLAAHLLLLVWTGWLCRPYLERHLLRPLLGGVGAAGLMAAALALVSGRSVWLRILIGAAVYAAAAGPGLLPWVRRRRRPA